MEGNNNGGTWPSPQDRQNQGNQNNSPAIGTGEGESPLMKGQEKVDMRTLSSDMNSTQQSGGGAPRPYTPGQDQSPAVAQKTDQITPPGMAVKDMGVVPPQTPSGGTPSVHEKGPDMPKSGNGKGPFVAILVFIVIVGLAAVGYFFIYPNFFAPSGDNQQAATPPVETQQNGQTPTVPVATTTVPTTPTSTESQVPADNTTSTPPSVSTVEIHSSFFKTPADLVFDTKLTSFGLADLTAPLAFNPTSLPLLREIVWKTENNKPLAFSQVSSIFLPTFFSSSFTDSFEPDFTMFSYTNTSGTWLGFVAKLKDGVTMGPVQDSMSGLQHDPDLKNLFLEDPGVMGAWKDGKVLTHAASEVSFAKSGATLSYVWFDRYLIVSTNLDAAKEAATRLGY